MFKKLNTSFEKYAEQNAFYLNDQYYTYTQFAYLISGIRSVIEQYKKQDEPFIGIITRCDIETYATIFAAWYSGCGFVPINPHNPIERNLNIIKQSGIQKIFTSIQDEKLKNAASDISLTFITSRNIHNHPIHLEAPKINENDLAYLFFTSGSTGIPKGVPISHKNLHAFIDSFLNQHYSINEHDRFLQMFDLTFDLSVMSYLIPLCIGACVYPINQSEIKYMAVYQLMDKHDITFALMVPSILSYLRPHFKDIKLPHLKYNLFCGEVLYQDITQEWSECIPNAIIQNVYGPTENTIFCTNYQWQKNDPSSKTFHGIVSIGKPMKHTQAIIVDERLKPVAQGEKGELCLTGNLLTQEYWENPELNKKAFFIYQQMKYYRTGDIAFVDNEGDIMFCGRDDQQIKIQGFRVELSEIEFHIRTSFQHISNVAAIPYHNQIGNIQIHLFVEDFNDDTHKLHEHLKTKVPEYMIPSNVSVLQKFPQNANGKTDRKKLRQLLTEL